MKTKTMKGLGLMRHTTVPAILCISALCILIPELAAAAPAACTLNATTANFSSVFSGAGSGAVICLASGSYGSFSGGAKSGMVTIQPASGASVSFSGGNFGSSVRNITIRGITFTGPVEVSPPSNILMNLIFDGDTWGNVGHSTHEGRLSIVGGGAASGSGVQVMNSTFGPGGCSDGIQDSSNGTEIGPNNEISGIVQGSCTEHADAIQPYASNNIYIHDNYFHDNEQGIMSPDGVSTGYRITNNVIHTATAYPCMHLGDTRNGTVTHNVCRNGAIRVYGGNQNVSSQNMVVQNNAASIDNSACTGCTVDHNQTVTYTGGSGRCAYATASPKGTASDGTDIGLNDCSGGGGPSNVPPVVGFITATPADVDLAAPGVQEYAATTVQYMASASDADNDPLTYQWYYTLNGGSRMAYGAGSLSSGGGTAQVNFSYPSGSAGTHYVWIVSVTDGKSTAVEQSLAVAIIAQGDGGQTSLPVPDLRGIDHSTFAPSDEISFSYPVSGVTFEWTFTAAMSHEQRAMSPAIHSLLGGAPATTSSPRFTPASIGLTPGTYQLTVTASQGGQTVSAGATITLVSGDFSQVKVFPNPWRKDRHATDTITFANLPGGSTVKMFTVSGHEVAELKESGGSANWNTQNESGNPVASGLYLYLITDGQGNKTKGKVAVIK